MLALGSTEFVDDAGKRFRVEFVPERPEGRDSLWVKLGLPFMFERLTGSRKRFLSTPNLERRYCSTSRALYLSMVPQLALFLYRWKRNPGYHS